MFRTNCVRETRKVIVHQTVNRKINPGVRANGLREERQTNEVDARIAENIAIVHKTSTNNCCRRTQQSNRIIECDANHLSFRKILKRMLKRFDYRNSRNPPLA